ncbi:MAG: Mrp/NBP35 family ATP-binding protein [Anaerolineales bacterium]|nr:Mrp/NBP35 family ATP-binding protein [Anaerolineales bacterium]
MIKKEQVLEVLTNIIHPEIKKNLVELGMIRDVETGPDRIRFTLVLPFMEVPIKDDLIRNASKAVEELDSSLTVEVKLAEMSQQERAGFMAAADGGSGPARSMNKIQNTLAVLSGKGGVGKSSVTALLAVALQRRGKKVGVLDADITGPSIPMMFGLDQHPAAGPLGILPVETKTGIRVMSINLLLPGADQAVIWRGPLISNAIKQFWQDVAWGSLDYLIVDLPPGTSDASLTVMQSIPLNGIVLVTSPQDLAGMVVRKAAHMAQQMKAPILGVVENMSYITCPHCAKKIEVFGPSRAQNTATQLGLSLIGQLPLDPELARRCDAGEIESYAGDQFVPIAEKVADLASLISAK